MDGLRGKLREKDQGRIRRRRACASSALASFALALSVGLFGADLRAAPDGGSALGAEVRCEKIGSPGRLRCEAEARSGGEGLVRWADAQIVSAPPWLTILKGRLGPGDASLQEASVFRFAFSVVARERGRGLLRVRLRAVLCEGERCVPAESVAEATVVVGENLQRRPSP